MKVGPNTELCPGLYKIWHSQQIEHANYEYNICQSLENLRDYRSRMIIGCKIQVTVRI